MAAAATVCPLLIAATLLGLCSLISVVHCQNFHTDCSIQHPVRIVQNSMGTMCVVNNNTAAIQTCMSFCLNLSYKVGALNSSSQCICSNVTSFDLNYCCSNIQCPAACEFQNIYCNQAIHQCEANVSLVPLDVLDWLLQFLSLEQIAGLFSDLLGTCNSVCTGNGFQSGTSSSLLGCTCKGCSGITNAGPDACNRVSSALPTCVTCVTCVMTSGAGMIMPAPEVITHVLFPAEVAEQPQRALLTRLHRPITPTCSLECHRPMRLH